MDDEKDFLLVAGNSALSLALDQVKSGSYSELLCLGAEPLCYSAWGGVFLDLRLKSPFSK